MESHSNINTGKLIGAVVISAIVGVGIGMLFAPNKGSVTRAQLMKSGKKMKGKLSRKLKNPVEVSMKSSKRPPLL